MSDQHDHSEYGWEAGREKRMNVVYDESITQRQGFQEHAAQGIEGAGYNAKARSWHGRRTARRLIGALAAIAIFISSLYGFLVYSSIPFIEKWRTIYIETAMGTMTHHWLAEMFLPQNVIDDVMSSRNNVEEEQKGLSSTWKVKSPEEETVDFSLAARPWEELKSDFQTYYPEIDWDSLEEYLDAHGSDCIDENGYLVIDEADYEDEDTGIRTTKGDPVCVLDTRNGIVILNLIGDTYYGKFAIIKNPKQVNVQASDYLGSDGEYVSEITENYDGILGINASGFYDPDGSGNGGEAYGMIFSNGERLRGREGCSMKVISLNTDDQLNVSDSKPDNAREAMQFDPVLILDGDLLISGSSGWGLQPRSVIGQTEDGQILLSVVDGRQPGYSVGITLGDLSDIFYKYGAYEACNMDGGSSSIMYYDGRNITTSSSTDPENGRHVPDAWVVQKAN